MPKTECKVCCEMTQTIPKQIEKRRAHLRQKREGLFMDADCGCWQEAEMGRICWVFLLLLLHTLHHKVEQNQRCKTSDERDDQRRHRQRDVGQRVKRRLDFQRHLQKPQVEKTQRDFSKTKKYSKKRRKKRQTLPHNEPKQKRGRCIFAIFLAPCLCAQCPTSDSEKKRGAEKTQGLHCRPRKFPRDPSQQF